MWGGNLQGLPGPHPQPGIRFASWCCGGRRQFCYRCCRRNSSRLPWQWQAGELPTHVSPGEICHEDGAGGGCASYRWQGKGWGIAGGASSR